MQRALTSSWFYKIPTKKAALCSTPQNYLNYQNQPVKHSNFRTKETTTNREHFKNIYEHDMINSNTQGWRY